jgi:hypothetical protein
MKFSISICTASLAVVTTLAGCDVSNRTARTEFHGQLLEIIRERQRLWEAAGEPEFDRSRDISALVCPVVSSEALETLHLAAPVDVQVNRNVEQSVGGLPSDTSQWVVEGDTLDIFGGRNSMVIYTAPSSFCQAAFGNVH